MSNLKEKPPKGTQSIRNIELAPGFFVSAYQAAKDGALVVEFEGHPPDDEDCDHIRIYVNDGFAATFVGPDDPRYGKTEAERPKVELVPLDRTLDQARDAYEADPCQRTAKEYRVVARRLAHLDQMDNATLAEILLKTSKH